MICRFCSVAADTGMPHVPCAAPGCACQHRPPRGVNPVLKTCDHPHQRYKTLPSGDVQLTCAVCSTTATFPPDGTLNLAPHQRATEQAEVVRHPMAGRVLTSSDPQPPAGSLVRDDCGTVWVNDGYYPVCWVRPDAEVHDPESWTKIAGNYGPVTVLKWGDERVDQVMRQVAGQR